MMVVHSKRALGCTYTYKQNSACTCLLPAYHYRTSSFGRAKTEWEVKCYHKMPWNSAQCSAMSEFTVSVWIVFATSNVLFRHANTPTTFCLALLYSQSLRLFFCILSLYRSFRFWCMSCYARVTQSHMYICCYDQSLLLQTRSHFISAFIVFSSVSIVLALIWSARLIPRSNLLCTCVCAQSVSCVCVSSFIPFFLL